MPLFYYTRLFVTATSVFRPLVAENFRKNKKMYFIRVDKAYVKLKYFVKSSFRIMP